MRALLPALAFGLVATAASAQSANPPPTPFLHLSLQDITSRLNKPGQTVAEKPDSHESYYTLIVTRHGDGTVERHDHWIDYITVISGEATFAYGGTQNGNTVDSEGESHGGGINGATTVTLHAGDFLQVPTGLPHQMSKPSANYYYTVVKVRV